MVLEFVELFKLKSDLARGKEFCVNGIWDSCKLRISPKGASTLRDFFKRFDDESFAWESSESFRRSWNQSNKTKKYYIIYLISQIKNKREKQKISQKCFTYQSFIAHQQWVSIVDGGWQHLTWCSNFLPIFQMIINYLLASTVISHPMFGNGALTFQNETITATFLSHGLRRRRWTEQHKRHIKDQCRNEVFQPLMSSNDFDVYTYIFITLFAERIQFFLLIFENL